MNKFIFRCYHSGLSADYGVYLRDGDVFLGWVERWRMNENLPWRWVAFLESRKCVGNNFLTRNEAAERLSSIV